MATYIHHSANSRGHANHGWLDSYHTFSFANYYNPERVNFGSLRVLNDDVISGGMGFDMHPHDNMEIISIPLEGALEHKDSMGTVSIIKSGDIQVMSAGSGIYHSEYNHSTDSDGKFLQIWVFPNEVNVNPRYDQKSLKVSERINCFQQIVSPNKNDERLWIHQNAWFYLGTFDKDYTVEYNLKRNGNGVYLFVIKGNFSIDNYLLNPRDGLGVTDFDILKIVSKSSDSELLIMEVPMEVY